MVGSGCFSNLLHSSTNNDDNSKGIDNFQRAVTWQNLYIGAAFIYLLNYLLTV